MNPQQVYKFIDLDKNKRSDFIDKVNFFIEQTNRKFQIYGPTNENWEDLNFNFTLCSFFSSAYYDYEDFPGERERYGEVTRFFEEHMVPLFSERGWEVSMEEKHDCSYRGRDCRKISIKPKKSDKISKFEIMDI